MKTIRCSMSIILLSVFVATQLSSVTSIQPDYDFFLFVQRWPGAECSGKKGCCYSTTGKPPAAFGIHGLWPQYNNTKLKPPTKCDPNSKNPFDLKKINDLIPSLENNWPSLACPSRKSSELWKHEWVKHGTCSLSTLTQHEYFNATLKLKAEKNLLQILQVAKIEPNGSSYKYADILQALTDGIGFVPGIECNDDKTSKNTKQLYEVSFCVDKSGSKIIYCPVYQSPKNCANSKLIKFPKFGIKGSSDLKAEL